MSGVPGVARGRTASGILAKTVPPKRVCGRFPTAASHACDERSRSAKRRLGIRHAEPEGVQRHIDRLSFARWAT